MLDLLARVLGRQSRSAAVAKERLRLVLVHDRSAVAPEIMEELRRELVRVISTYMEVDEDSVEVSLDTSDEQVALVASVPVRRVRRAVSGS